MLSVVLFAEDYAHEEILKRIISKFFLSKGIEVVIKVLGSSGGHGKVVTKFKEYILDLNRGRVSLPDILVVGTDANCVGHKTRKSELEKANHKYAAISVYAIPDPHIERWLLVDSSAFKKVLGKGCKPPTMKCARDEYKNHLFDAVHACGVTPPLGGIEYAGDIIDNMDIQNIRENDSSFDNFIGDLSSVLKVIGKTP